MRKKLATKICAIAMTAAMVATAAGCGNDGGTSSEGSSSTPQSQESSSEEQGGADEASDSEESSSEEGGEVADGGETGGEEETYDFGGAVVRVSGGSFGSLDEENKLDEQGNEKKEYTQTKEYAAQIEAKYNIKLEYAPLTGTDGYSDTEAIIAGMTAGEAYADIFCKEPAVMVGLREYLADITDTADQLQIGSTYIEAGTFNGKVYGWTYDDPPQPYVLVYSREFLQSIGMEKTPTDMFVEGKWDYESCRQYLMDLKAKLPDGTYPIAVHSTHWVKMAPGANGVVGADANCNVNLTATGYLEAIDFYKSLISDQLAAPAEEVTINDDGSISANQLSGGGDMSAKTEANKYVMSVVESWAWGDLQKDKGDWGIVPAPWGPQVTCSGDYTTLSDNYMAAAPLWTNLLVPKAEYRSAGAKEIPDIVLHKIGKDFYDLVNPKRAKMRTEAWETESKGETYVNVGDAPGTPRSFCTEQDIEVFDWLHTRGAYDWTEIFNTNGIARMGGNAAYAICAGQDSRSTGESFMQEAEENMKRMGLK